MSKQALNINIISYEQSEYVLCLASLLSSPKIREFVAEAEQSEQCPNTKKLC